MTLLPGLVMKKVCVKAGNTGCCDQCVTEPPKALTPLTTVALSGALPYPHRFTTAVKPEPRPDHGSSPYPNYHRPYP